MVLFPFCEPAQPGISDSPRSPEKVVRDLEIAVGLGRLCSYIPVLVKESIAKADSTGHRHWRVPRHEEQLGQGLGRTFQLQFFAELCKHIGHAPSPAGMPSLVAGLDAHMIAVVLGNVLHGL